MSQPQLSTVETPAYETPPPHPLPPIPPDLAVRPILISENAAKVLQKRYLRKGPDGQPAENIPEMFWRVAWHIALPDAQAGADVMATARRFYDLLTNFHFMPNSPTFTGAGTPLNQCAACFVLPIEDDMGKLNGGIFDTLRDAVLIQQTGGGNGFSFSRLRPRGALVHTSMGTATGPVGFLRVYDKAFGEVSQGGCLTPETLVFTERGLLRLDEIVNPALPGWRTHTLQVATDAGWRVSPQGYNHGVAPVLRVETEVGLALTGTPNHKVKVLSADGPVWRRLDEIAPDDTLLVKLGQHKGRFCALQHPTSSPTTQEQALWPSLLDEELAFLVGYLTGDGITAHSDPHANLCITVAADSYLVEELPALIQRLFGTVVEIQPAASDSRAPVTFQVTKRVVKEFLLRNGLLKSDGAETHVPRLIRQSPAEVVGAFLRGLFEAHGNIANQTPALASTSEPLIRETAMLLLGLGCPVSVWHTMLGTTPVEQVPLWNLQIDAESGRHPWQSRIGCDRRSRFQVCHVDRVPEPLVLPSHVVSAAPYPPAGSSAVHPALPHIAGTAPHDHPTPLSLPNDLWPVKIISVAPAGEALTLDIEVDENHTYLANGIVTHNSRRGANMAVLRVDHPDIREFIRCKAKEGDVSNFNISVGMLDSFMAAVEAGTTFDLVFDGKVYETVDARELFSEIVAYAYRNGEPGVLFLDAANRTNPVPHLYELEATNP